MGLMAKDVDVAMTMFQAAAVPAPLLSQVHSRHPTWRRSPALLTPLLGQVQQLMATSRRELGDSADHTQMSAYRKTPVPTAPR